MSVLWSDDATLMLQEIFEYIARDKPLAAQRLKQEILLRSDLLAQHPRIGRLSATPGIRIFPLSGTPYVLFYRIFDDKVAILAVVHGHRIRTRP